MSARELLRWSTPEAWAVRALEEPCALLSDHAHCELGAAAAAQGFVARAVRDRALIERMGALAIEELRHFRRVHRALCALGGALEPVRRNPYVESLARAARSGPGARGATLPDRLLVAALVEARSHERFVLLARHAQGSLASLYAELADSEAGHAALFLGLARERSGAGLEARLDELARAEAALVRAAPFAARVHSGPPVQPRARASERDPGRAAARLLQP